jgi:hypothetical protein
VITLLPGSHLAWQVADLAAGQGGLITITAQVGAGFAQRIISTAWLTTTARITNTADLVAGPLYTLLLAKQNIYLPVIRH